MRGTPTLPSHVPSPDQDRELLLYKFDACPYCRRVLSQISRLGVTVPTRDTARDSGARDELRERTGRTQVPCLFVDGEPLFESSDINVWLAAYAERATPSS